MTTILVPISRLSGKNNLNSQAEITKKFGMPIPHYASLTLTDDLVTKMKEVQGLLEQYKVSEISFISSTVKEQSHSTVRLYNDSEQEIIIKSYEEIKKQYPVFEDRHFNLTTSRIHSGKFVAEFMYSNDNGGDFVFETNSFDLPK
jgi:hypothetical protein